MNAYVLALCANISFALGSQFFTYYTRLFSSVWMNSFKAGIAALGFLLTIYLTSGFNDISSLGVIVFFISGAIGLGIGDIFLLKAFGEIGPGRTMVIFGFHPIIVGVFSYIIFSHSLDSQKLWGILFFMICLIIFSIESFKSHGEWKIKGLVFAFLGMTLDATGILLTRFAFDSNTEVTPLEGNFYRCLGAIIVYLIISKVAPFQFKTRLMSLSKKSLFFLCLGAFFGTYLSLALYLQAIKIADNLALISSISITSVIFASTFECIWEKKLPSIYLILSFISFAFGMYFVFK